MSDREPDTLNDREPDTLNDLLRAAKAPPRFPWPSEVPAEPAKADPAEPSEEDNES